MAKLPDLVIGDLRINPPIIQGGMGVNISRANLASAVANEGAVGTISAITGGFSQTPSVEMHVRELREQIRQARRKTGGILAVNILVALTNYDDIVRTSVEEGIDIIFSGAGIPLHLPKLVAGTRTKICPIVSSGRTADIICKNWERKYQRLPDAIVVEGPMAGGHLGYRFSELEQETQGRLESIMDEVLAATARYRLPGGNAIPVIAAGGVFDGKDIARLLRRGAAGIQMGTRFVCTNECDASDEFKQAYLHARKEDIIIIDSPVGLPGRALRNEFLERAGRHEIKFACHYRCLKTCDPSRSPYCIADALLNAAEGNLKAGFVFVGANVYRIKEIVPVKTLIRELVQEAEKEFAATC